MFKSLLPWKHTKTKVMVQEQTMEDEHILLEPKLVPCATCGRTFFPLPLKKHAPICEKSAAKKRKVFDSLKQRIEGTELAQFHQKTYLKRTESTPKTAVKERKWKEDHLKLVSAIRSAKVASREMSPKKLAPSASNERCPFCERQFGPKAFDRHVEWCKEHQTRLRKSPANSLAKERLEARTKYKVPPLGKPKRVSIKEKYSSGSLLNRTESICSVKSSPSNALKLNRTPSIRKPNSVARIETKELKKTPKEEKNRPKRYCPSRQKINSLHTENLESITVAPLKLLKHADKKLVTWKEIKETNEDVIVVYENEHFSESKSQDFIDKLKEIMCDDKESEESSIEVLGIVEDLEERKTNVIKTRSLDLKSLAIASKLNKFKDFERELRKNIADTSSVDLERKADDSPEFLSDEEHLKSSSESIQSENIDFLTDEDSVKGEECLIVEIAEEQSVKSEDFLVDADVQTSEEMSTSVDANAQTSNELLTDLIRSYVKSEISVNEDILQNMEDKDSFFSLNDSSSEEKKFDFSLQQETPQTNEDYEVPKKRRRLNSTFTIETPSSLVSIIDKTPQIPQSIPKQETVRPIRLLQARFNKAPRKFHVKKDTDNVFLLYKRSSTHQYDPFVSAERQLMELLDVDDFPTNKTRPQTAVTIPPITKTAKSATANKKRASVIDPPPSFQDEDEFEILENLVNQQFHNEKRDKEDFNVILNQRKYSDDMSSIDSNLINENDNLALPDNFRSYSPASTEDTDTTIRNEEGKKKKVKKEVGKKQSKTNKVVDTGETLAFPIKAEDLFAVDDKMYAEYKIYEEMYLKEKEQSGSKKRSKNSIKSYGIDLLNEEQNNATKISDDSAYGSLNRTTPKPVPKLSAERKRFDSASSSGSDSKPLRMSKFCHECGNKYPVATAKFCVECGVKRLLL